MKKLYAIVDIETTGSTPARDRITEIAIVHHDGTKVTGRYSTLINPERSIPYHIIGMTGITNDMVADAPRFYEVARDIIEWTEGRVFIAHNVHFDYGFLKEEFKSLGYTFSRSTLDTVRLSRLAFPGYRSYSLGNLIQIFNLKVKDRHRALDDALATAEIFTMIMESGAYTGTVDNFITMGLRISNLPVGITLDDILKLPEDHGVYYFRNQQDTLIYVGKSKNIKTRIAQHFTDHSAKSTRIRQSTHSMDYETTGNELAALIKESIEIRSLNPLYNKAQRNSNYPYAIIIDESGPVPVFRITKAKEMSPGQKSLKYFTHKKLAEHYRNMRINELADIFQSMDEESDLSQSLLNVHLGLAPAEDKAVIRTYHEIFREMVDNIRLWFDNDFILEASGRSIDEKCIFLIYNGRFYGYNYFAADHQLYDAEAVRESVRQVEYHPELDLIIHTFMKKKPGKYRIIDVKYPEYE